MSDTMIERVAKAIESTSVNWDEWYTGAWYVKGPDYQSGMLDTKEEAEQICRVQRARAAIEAMREPTPEMVQAGCDATFGPHALSPEQAHTAGYAAMLTAALSDTGGAGGE